MDHREPPSDNPDRDAAGGLAPPSDPAGSLAPPDGSPSTAVEPPSPGAPSSTDELSSAVAALTEDDVEPATAARAGGSRGGPRTRHQEAVPAEGSDPLGGRRGHRRRPPNPGPQPGHPAGALPRPGRRGAGRPAGAKRRPGHR